MDPRASADAMDERNGLHQCACPQADVDKKMEFSLLKKRSEILAPLKQLITNSADLSGYSVMNHNITLVKQTMGRNL